MEQSIASVLPLFILFYCSMLGYLPYLLTFSAPPLASSPCVPSNSGLQARWLSLPIPSSYVLYRVTNTALKCESEFLYRVTNTVLKCESECAGMGGPLSWVSADSFLGLYPFGNRQQLLFKEGHEEHMYTVDLSWVPWLWSVMWQTSCCTSV